MCVTIGLTHIITPSRMDPSFDTYPAFIYQKEIRIHWLNISIRNTSHHEANLISQFPRGTSRTYGQIRLCNCDSNSKRKTLRITIHSGGTNRADMPCTSYHSVLLSFWLVRKHENRGRNVYIKLARYENNAAYRKKNSNLCK